MKNFYFIILSLLLFNIGGYAQNNAPIAVNDTLYVNFNDSLSFIEPYNYVVVNDYDFDILSIDTTFYYGSGIFKCDSVVSNIDRITYEPAYNYSGVDTVIYVLKDDGIPIKYDTATIYFIVKKKRLSSWI